MCSIVASFDKEKFLELLQLNAHRGTHSHSLAVFQRDGTMIECWRASGAFRETLLVPYTGSDFYFVGHQQAPTTEARTVEYIHPSKHADTYLWHNGIIKADMIAKMQFVLDDDTKWDTALLNQWIVNQYNLGEVDGSFACIQYFKGINALYVFRNELSPLYIDDNLNVSSTAFSGAKYLPPGELFNLDLEHTALRATTIARFKTKDTFYVDLS